LLRFVLHLVAVGCMAGWVAGARGVGGASLRLVRICA
jgi:hypothetical protein